MKHFFPGLIALTFLFIGCNKQSVTTPDFKQNLLKIASKTLTDGRIVTIYSTETLKTGYNPLFIDVSGDVSGSQPTVTLSTLMDMGSMQHSSPSVPPVYNQQIKLFEAAAVFTMPSSSKEWALILLIDETEVVFQLDIELNKNKTVGTYTSPDNETYVVAFYPHSDFKVGMNPFLLFISKKESAMHFRPVTGLTIDFRPEMPSMGHGSPNNRNPIDDNNGFYHGTVNFTMTGDWRLFFKIQKDGDRLLDDFFFDVVF